MRKKSLPPSRAGNGKRFATPRFIVISAIINSRLSIFLSVAAAAVTSAIISTVPTGPASSEAPYLPVTISKRLSHTSLAIDADYVNEFFTTFLNVGFSPTIIKS